MKITFINPKTTNLNTRDLSSTPPKIRDLIENNLLIRKSIEFSRKAFGALGLLTIAALVPRHFKVEFFDENMEEIDFDHHFDLVAIGGNISQINRILTICNILKKRKVPVVAGGTAVLTFPEMFVKRGISIIVGEGESLFKVFINDFLTKKTKLIYDNTIAQYHIDLKYSPIPRFDLAAKYPYSMVGIQISRGCPYNCSFCQVTSIFGNQYRYKPIDNIMKEIKFVKKQWPNSFFFFYDDNPFFKKNFSLELFKRIFVEENINLGRWGANANVTLYRDQELMNAITTNGPVSFLGIGFESISKDILSIINKNKMEFLSEYKEAINIFKKNNINPVGYFIFGFENSKQEDLQQIVNFIIENEIDSELTRLTPMPGTILYERLKKEYEHKYGKMHITGLRQWGKVRDYLTEKSGMSEDETKNKLIDAYSVIYNDKHFNNSGGPIPFYFLF